MIPSLLKQEVKACEKSPVSPWVWVSIVALILLALGLRGL